MTSGGQRWQALEISQTSGYHLHDSLVLAALEAGCDAFYSEDPQDGQSMGPLTIRNPFASGKKKGGGRQMERRSVNCRTRPSFRVLVIFPNAEPVRLRWG